MGNDIDKIRSRLEIRRKRRSVRRKRRRRREKRPNINGEWRDVCRAAE